MIPLPNNPSHGDTLSLEFGTLKYDEPRSMWFLVTEPPAMKRAEADRVYARVKSAIQEADEVVTNSSTLWKSARSAVWLEVGSYLIECEQLVVGSNSTCSSKVGMSFSGTATASGVLTKKGGSTSSTLADAVPVPDSSLSLWNSTAAFNSGGNLGGVVIRRFHFVVTVAGNLQTTFAQAVQTASHTAALKIGSHIKATSLIEP